MIAQLIGYCLANRFLVITIVVMVSALGAWNALHIPIDAVPDMTNTQVQVITNAGSLSPVEVEKYVSYPVEATMAGLPDVEEIRSVSRLGLSVVTIVFTEHTDLYRARSLVNERLPAAKTRVFRYGDPQIGTMTTALGEILQFEVRGNGYTPMELRSILDWQVAPLLQQVPGVTEINSHGGFYKTFEVQVNPERLAGYQLTLNEVMSALKQNNVSAGGGYIVHAGEQRFVRGESLLKTVEDIGNVVVKSREGGLPVLLKDLGETVLAPLTRQGVATRDGRGEIVTGMVMMLIGRNSRTVVQAAREKIDEIGQTLPPGVRLDIIYDRSHLISRTLRTVVSNLLEGGTLVFVILFVLLGNFRAGLMVALAIPLSMLFASNLMVAAAISASLMSLGAIDFGLIVDSSVIMIENCMRRLSEKTSSLAPGVFLSARARFAVIRDAALEVRKPTMFGELIIAVVYLPILLLEGTEGKLFRPMALTVLFALAGSMLLSLTLMPVLAWLGLPRRMEEKEVMVIRAIKRIYMPLVAIAVRVPVATLGIALFLVAFGIPVGARLGAEFMPRLDEGDLLIEALRLPSASLEDAVVRSTEIENVLKLFPEVSTVFCKTGRPEIANDVMGVHQTDVWVMLKPREQWPEQKTRDALIDEIAARLNERVPGVVFGFTQPIEMRVDELVAGVKADVAVLLFGDDLELLAEKGKAIERLLKSIPGAVDVRADYQATIPTIAITTKQDQLARYGIQASEVMDAVATIGGKEVGEVFEGRAIYPVMVRLPEAWRNDMDRLMQVPVRIIDGQPITLGLLADLSLQESPPGIEHEAGRRRTFIAANVRGRDVASFVQEAKKRVAEDIVLPPGYLLEWGGDFESLQSASIRLALITPIVLLLIWILLYSTLNSMRLAALIFLAVPMAASGGVLALAVREMPFSISAGVGFIALFGVAVFNGLVWVSAAERTRLQGMTPRDSALDTARHRLRPVLMTAMVASFGFLPMALNTTAGAEIQRPLATVVIGGIVTATLLTVFVIPAIYPWFVDAGSERELESQEIPV